jgi:hypothetical protein
MEFKVGQVYRYHKDNTLVGKDADVCITHTDSEQRTARIKYRYKTEPAWQYSTITWRWAQLDLPGATLVYDPGSP